MKIKQDPADFRVEELTDLRPGSNGPFALYRLEKRGWTTPDAIGVIRRRWKLPLARVAWGGLKDRHAETRQFISIYRGPRRGLDQRGIRLEYLGQVTHPYSARDIRGNRFEITVRNLEVTAATAALAATEALRSTGLPNYFDDQRFGSVGDERDFIARRMVRGEFEQALFLALAAPYAHDRGAAAHDKAILRANWGRWPECKALLTRSHARSLVDYLCHHPEDYRGAVARLRPELQGLYLSAFQSYLWNAILEDWIATSFPADELLRLSLRLGQYPAPRRLTTEQLETWRSRRLPLPAARWPFDPSAPWASSALRVLEREQLQWHDLRIRGLRKPFFTRGERNAWCLLDDLAAEVRDDDRHPSRSALCLQFTLPRGSYATLILKRLLAG